MNEKKIPKYITWKEKNPQNIVSYNEDRNIIMKFENIFNDMRYEIFDTFIINKTSYKNSVDITVNHIAYFMEYYDTNQELAVGYLQLKNALDTEHMYTPENMDKLIKDIYNRLITPSIIKELDLLIEYNNTINIELEKDGSKRYKTSKQYAESLEFNNEHTALMLKISYCMKIIAPVMLHYFSINRMKVNKKDNIIYKFYKPLFTDYFTDKINIYNKLYVYVKARIHQNRSQNYQLYDQREIAGYDISSVIQDFLRGELITEIMYRYEFTKGSNPVAFNKVAVDNQLKFLWDNKYTRTPTLLTNERNSDGVSGIEKLEMNLSRIDEGVTIIADLTVEDAIRIIQEKYKFDLTDEELDYMVKNHRPSEIQKTLITAFFSKFFGESRNIKLVNKRQYCIMVLILKKLLLTYDANNESDIKISFLPFIISGNLEGKEDNKPIRNNKFISKLENTESYSKLISHKFKYINEIRPNFIVNIISTLANSTFTYCAYEYPEIYGEKIEVDLNKLAIEIITFLSVI